MALSLTDLFEKRNDSAFKNKVAAACWRYAKILLAKETPTTEELKLAEKMLSSNGSGTLEKFALAAAVLIDDGPAEDSDIENAVKIAAEKLVVLEGV